VHKNGGDHDSDGAEGVSENMEKDPVHVLVTVGMSMPMIMSVVCMVEGHDTDKIHEETRNTHHQKLPDTVHLAAGG
jgi:mannose/fructose-specific phosphotransferase system component IIA